MEQPLGRGTASFRAAHGGRLTRRCTGIFAQLYDDTPKEQSSETVSISENEIYFKRQPLTEEQKKHGSYVDENGNLHVKNLSAFWIPELTTTEKVGHTTYTVTGSYEGKESLKKLERIVAKNAQQKFEDEGADE